jgi:DNA invertase Pin-like site-specific DNA recombinase
MEMLRYLMRNMDEDGVIPGCKRIARQFGIAHTSVHWRINALHAKGYITKTTTGDKSGLTRIRIISGPDEYEEPRCQIEGCEERHRSHGYCRLHYHQVETLGWERTTAKAGKRGLPRRFTPDQVRDIRRKRSDGIKAKHLAAQYGCSVHHIYKIAHRHCYQDVP